MQILVSGSGPRAGATSKSVDSFIKKVFPTIGVVHETDVPRDSNWAATIVRTLKDVDHGIFVLSSLNVRCPWTLFQAGTIARNVERSRLYTLLVDESLEPSNLGLYSSFQATKMASEEIALLARSINARLRDDALDEELLNTRLAAEIPELLDEWSEIQRAAIRSRREYERTMAKNVESMLDILSMTAAEIHAVHEQAIVAIHAVNTAAAVKIDVRPIPAGPIVEDTLWHGGIVTWPDGSRKTMTAIPGGGEFRTWEGLGMALGKRGPHLETFVREMTQSRGGPE